MSHLGQCRRPLSREGYLLVVGGGRSEVGQDEAGLAPLGGAAMVHARGGAARRRGGGARGGGGEQGGEGAQAAGDVGGQLGVGQHVGDKAVRLRHGGAVHGGGVAPVAAAVVRLVAGLLLLMLVVVVTSLEESS